MNATCKNCPKTVLILGASGSGKDTQMNLLVEKCGYTPIGTGDMFREELAKKTPLGIEANKYWGKGHLVPDDLVYQLFSEYIKKYDSSKPWIFSGVVRTVPQIKLFDDLLSGFGRKLERVIYFNLSEEDAIVRMSLRRHCPMCGREYHLKYNKPKNDEVCDDDGTKLSTREDDHIGPIHERLEYFRNKVLPAIEVYRKRGILLEIDAAPTVEEIHEDVMKKINK